ncbi:TfuA-like protein [Pseudobacteriovorax antillogorgiicola]|uniref:TfuA-like core domain-containing protein n=1 Tax=Pseudobacteriovorax antillogorgiicola TaxID=1513793 RepID=A0A1Y6C215_9BACT|nr:TfuA-like protein [Pseudobacteriovorax antillogorgiicola]TCS51182.1 hypothetical protein EDD56_11166 [Pseudobacteriovorax antillogorgiicola]SMF37858.1 hypothetical protein SAMN06296036_111112 [Pseudobacteriovorax antillogorgiicola]
MSKTHIYSGTSIQIASSSDDIVVHPPIARGCLRESRFKCNDRILIIDGFFHQKEAVDLTEIRRLIGIGVSIAGASSMGALRAVEAQSLGMKGFGHIYRWIRRQIIVDDEIVAQLVDPRNFQPITFALVDVIYALRTLKYRKLIDFRQYSELVSVVSERHYTERDLDMLRTAMRKVGADQEMLGDNLKAGTRKKSDAMIAIKKLGIDSMVEVL